MTLPEKADAGFFSSVAAYLMFTSGDQVWAYVAWRNTFMHSLGTVLMTVFCSALLSLMFFGVYSLFRGWWKGWGRALLLPVLLVSRWLYPIILTDFTWAETNPDPQQTAAIFAIFAASIIVIVSGGIGGTVFEILASKSGTN